MEINQDAVITALREILPTVDLETATQRSITESVQQKLGVDAIGSAFKPLIKHEIDAFLLDQANAGAEQGADQEAAPQENEEDGYEADEAPPSKKQRASTGAPVPTTDLGFELTSKRFAKMRIFNKRPLVDIREYYEKEGELVPGAKGISLNVEQWRKLVDKMQDINDAAGRQDGSYFFELGSDKRVSVSTYKGKLLINIREYYEKDGEKYAGKKGISLPPDQWTKLCAVHEELSAQVQAHAGTAPAVPASAKKSGAAGTSVNDGAGTSAQATAAATAEAAEGPVLLSSNRRAEVSSYKGSMYCNIREYYEKDGKQLPGKKGITLAKDQFTKLKEHAEELTAALQNKDTNYEVALSSKRKATISAYKGKHSVDIREYYDKDGEMAPGAKGISLNEEQWQKLKSGLAGLDAAFGAA